jgi:hypothetical protein
VTICGTRVRPAATDHELLWTAVGLSTALMAWLVLQQPWPASLASCPFKAMTGWPCLTCGGTRAVRALFAGEAGEALRANPLVALSAAAWAGYAVYGAGAVAGVWPRLRLRLHPGEATRVRLGALVAIAATWAFLVADGR